MVVKTCHLVLSKLDKNMLSTLQESIPCVASVYADFRGGIKTTGHSSLGRFDVFLLDWRISVYSYWCSTTFGLCSLLDYIYLTAVTGSGNTQ